MGERVENLQNQYLFSRSQCIYFPSPTSIFIEHLLIITSLQPPRLALVIWIDWNEPKLLALFAPYHSQTESCVYIINSTILRRNTSVHQFCVACSIKVPVTYRHLSSSKFSIVQYCSFGVQKTYAPGIGGVTVSRHV